VREYDIIADWYAGDRGRTVGVREALDVVKSLPSGSRIVDIGCGNGVPITEALVRAGYRVVGLDSSAKMLMQFRTNLPGTPAVRGTVQSCPFDGGVFDAAVSWGMIFHLTRQDQVRAFASVARILKPGAPFLFTAADVDGDDAGITGTMNGTTFHYYGFTADQYRALLMERGLTLIDVHDDPGVSTYFLARKFS
jgi:SAM-dependent methyltransferase